MNESLKELAVRYFEGPIAPEEECELFGFLSLIHISEPTRP